MSSQSDTEPERYTVRVDGDGNVLFESVEISESLREAVGDGDLPSSQSAADASFQAPTSSPSDAESALSRLSLEPDDGEYVIGGAVDDLRKACMWGAVRGTQRASEHEDGPAIARSVLAKISKTEVDWCVLANLKPNQRGYPQITRNGGKFATVGEVVVWSKGDAKPPHYDYEVSSDVSHLCTQPRCTVPEHIIVESKVDNNSRKGCNPWVKCSEDCARCRGRSVRLLCAHTPPCVKYHSGYKSQKDLLETGICKDESDDTRQYLARRAEMAEMGLSKGRASRKK